MLVSTGCFQAEYHVSGIRRLGSDVYRMEGMDGQAGLKYEHDMLVCHARLGR